MKKTTIFATLTVPAAAMTLFAQAMFAQAMFAQAMFAQEGPVVMAQGAVGAIRIGEPNVLFHQEFTFNGRPITGQPYSADEKTVSIQTLADGTRITNTTTTRVYRDSQGRTRREMSLPALRGETAPHRLISISDPVSGANYTLDSENKTAHQMPFMAFGGEMKMITSQARVQDVPNLGAPVTSEVRIISSGMSGATKHEDLGTDVIEGVTAKGSRDTSVIEVGEIGNDRPITITNERWLASDLQIEVKSVHSDPRMGETTHTVTNISRTEPDASLFQVPSDYKIEDPKPFQTVHRDR